MSDSILDKVCSELKTELTRLTEKSTQLKAELKLNESKRRKAAAALNSLLIFG